MLQSPSPAWRLRPAALEAEPRAAASSLRRARRHPPFLLRRHSGQV
ncbi:MAG: hypothetical protein H5T43_04995 [Methanomethylovorans sp.]|nr:hypothetical protein [Methanomethylovorans sp.]